MEDMQFACIGDASKIEQFYIVLTMFHTFSILQSMYLQLSGNAKASKKIDRAAQF